MNTRYYVQEIAQNYQRFITDEPAELKVHPRFLHGLETDEFKNGYTTLLRLMQSLYSDIEKDPAAFGMTLVEISEANGTTANYSKSNRSFVRVPNLLLALGACGMLDNSFSLSVDGETLLNAAKKLNITNIASLLDRLKDYGFEITGYTKTVKAGGSLTVSFPDDRALTAVLKSFSDAYIELRKGDFTGAKDYFYMLLPDLLSAENVKEPKLSFEHFKHVLKEDWRGTAAELHERAAPHAKLSVKTQGVMRGSFSCVYTGKKSGMVLMTMKAEQGGLYVKLNLEHIGGYIGTVMEKPEDFREKIRGNAWNCSRCHDSCAGGFKFEMDGNEYSKCRGGAFAFNDISTAEAGYLRELLELELRREV